MPAEREKPRNMLHSISEVVTDVVKLLTGSVAIVALVLLLFAVGSQIRRNTIIIEPLLVPKNLQGQRPDRGGIGTLDHGWGHQDSGNSQNELQSP